MAYDAMGIQQYGSGMAYVLSRAFRTAHLLTADVRQAETAVLDAIDRFDPSRDPAEMLLMHTMRAAIRDPAEPSTHQPVASPEAPETFVPTEMRAVLGLSRDLRRCYVMRILAGVSQEASASLLRLSTRTIDEYTCAALLRLAGFEPS